jgi:hypothetical protein
VIRLNGIGHLITATAALFPSAGHPTFDEPFGLPSRANGGVGWNHLSKLRHSVNYAGFINPCSQPFSAMARRPAAGYMTA